VRVGGGALLGELDDAAQRHGLAVPAGQISHTGVGGLTLGGGIGWLMRHHGLTIDSLVAAEVVLADGEIVQASADEHADLFWALRGGGGEFGVVTRFEFRAHRVGPTVLGGMLVYPWEQARAAFQATRALMADAPDALTAFAVLITAPPQAPFPAEHQGRPVAVVAVAWSGDVDEGERALAPLRAGCPPLAATPTPTRSGRASSQSSAATTRTPSSTPTASVPEPSPAAADPSPRGRDCLRPRRANHLASRRRHDQRRTW